MSKSRVVSISHNGYYVAVDSQKQSEEEEFISELLGDEVEEKLKLLKKLHQSFERESKINEYESFKPKDSIDHIFEELNKRLSANSKRILSQYQQPDYKTLREKNTEIDLYLHPEPLTGSLSLDIKKTDYLNSNAEVRRLENRVEKEAEARILELVDKFPKIKTNTALLQYAHILLKELLRNKYLEQKHREFLTKTETCDVEVKHSYNREYKAPKDLPKTGTQNSLQSNADREGKLAISSGPDIQSRVASVCIDDSKCGTIKIGPIRSLDEVSETMNSGLATPSQGTPDQRSRRQTRGMTENQIRWLRAAHKYRMMYGPAGAPYNVRLLHQQQAIRLNQMCLAVEKREELLESINFLKQLLSGFKPATVLEMKERMHVKMETSVPRAEEAIPKTSTEKAEPLQECTTKKLPLGETVADEVKPKKLEPIFEVSSIRERSASAGGVEAEIMKTTLKTMDNARKSKELDLSKMEVLCDIAEEEKKLEDPVEVIPATKAEKGGLLFFKKNKEDKLAKRELKKELREKKEREKKERKEQERLARERAFKERMKEREKKEKEKEKQKEKEKEKQKQKETEQKDEYESILSYEDLIDLITVQSIAGTLEHKDFLDVEENATASLVFTKSTLIRQNSALGIMVQRDELLDTSLESENDMRSYQESASLPNTISLTFSSEFEDFQTLEVEALKFEPIIRKKRLTALTEYNFFREEPVKLEFDFEKFNRDLIMFNPKRQSFDIFETYMMALTKMDVK